MAEKKVRVECPRCDGVSWTDAEYRKRDDHLTGHGLQLRWQCWYCQYDLGSRRRYDMAKHVRGQHPESSQQGPKPLFISLIKEEGGSEEPRQCTRASREPAGKDGGSSRTRGEPAWSRSP